MKKRISLFLCMVLVLSLFCVNAAAAETPCMEAGVTVSEDGTVTVAVRAMKTAANARLTVSFDPAYLTYEDCGTAFAIHSVKAESGTLTIGLANASTSAVKAGDALAQIRFRVTGDWDKTELTVTAERYGGKSVNETLTLSVEGAGYRFDDVTAGQWFYEAVDHMASQGCIKGVSDSHFGPGLPMNRASFVTLLGRLEGNADTKAETGFVDVPYDSFYSGHVAWAVANGITNGMDATHFAPASSINRAQMVTFLYRYAVSEGIDVTVADPAAALARFPDAATLPAWAVEPFAWAVSSGIINGMDGKLAADGISNRAQVAVMLYRFFFEG